MVSLTMAAYGVDLSDPETITAMDDKTYSEMMTRINALNAPAVRNISGLIELYRRGATVAKPDTLGSGGRNTGAKFDPDAYSDDDLGSGAEPYSRTGTGYVDKDGNWVRYGT